MLTSVILIGCVIAFIWGIKTMDSKANAGLLDWLAVTLAPIVGIGTLLANCWQAALGLVIVLFVGLAMLRTLLAVLGNANGGQILKAVMVIGACIIALPPFWPIAIPLAVGLVGANLICAPITLLFSSVKGLMDGKG